MSHSPTDLYIVNETTQFDFQLNLADWIDTVYGRAIRDGLNEDGDGVEGFFDLERYNEYTSYWFPWEVSCEELYEEGIEEFFYTEILTSAIATFLKDDFTDRISSYRCTLSPVGTSTLVRIKGEFQLYNRRPDHDLGVNDWAELLRVWENNQVDR